MTSSPTMSIEEQADKLADVMSLAALFSTCVEAFGLIHPSKESDHEQKLALTKLGIQQGRLLIFGDAVGISSPPATIATHMVPSQAGATNPDPTLPIYFDPRDSRLDDPENRKVVEDTLSEIVDRPAHLPREQMMELYGLKPPKRVTYIAYPALDSNRLDAFRERYALLQDLSQELSSTRGPRRAQSITSQHWAIYDVERFSAFVSTVREQVDKLERLFHTKERIDKGMKADIRALGWHPEMTNTIIRKDWEKLKLINTACQGEYPDYVQAAETALNYINQEAHESKQKPFPPIVVKPIPEKSSPNEKETTKRRPGFLSLFKFGSFSKDKKKKDAKKNQNLPVPPPTTRSLSEDLSAKAPPESDNLNHVRSLSLPNNATPEMAALALDPPAGPSRMNKEAVRPDSAVDETDETPLAPVNTAVNAASTDQGQELQKADTYHSLIDRHDQFHGVGRIETKDIRAKAHAV